MVTKQSKKAKIILTLSIVLVLSAAAYAGYVLWGPGVKNNEGIATTEKKVEEIVERSPTTPEGVKETQQKLQDLAQNESDAEKKALYLYGVLDLYSDQDDYKNVIEVGMQIEALTKDANSAARIAGGYVGLKDFANAAKYYGIAMERSEKPTRPTERAPYNDYMILKQEAEAMIK